MTKIIDKKNDEKKFGLKADQIPFLIQSGILSKEGLGYQEKDIQKIYTKAKHYYDSGIYKEARGLFSFLCLIDKTTPAYLYGLAATAMMMNDLDVAIEAYLNYAGVVKSDPNPYYYASLCYEKKKDTLSALICLQTVVLRAGDQSQYQALKNRALMVINNFTHAISNGSTEER